MKIPIRSDELVLLQIPAAGLDPQELQRVLDPLNITAMLVNRFSFVEEDIKNLLVEHGVSYVWRLMRLQEAIMPQTTNVDPLVQTLIGMLQRLAPSVDFVIVDRFLLPMYPPSDYFDILISILTPIADRVKRIVIVTGPQFDQQLWEQVRITLQASHPQLKLDHSVTDDYHDRFWIADQSKGLLVGTSLNGLGRKYTVIDFLDPTDTRTIVEALKNQGLV